MPDLVALDEVKTFLNMKTTDNDAELKTFISATTPVVESYIGPVIAKTFAERHASGSRLCLREGPLLSVTSIAGFLTPLSSAINVATDIVIDAATSRVYLKSGDGFNDGPYLVTYVAGRAEIGEHIREAAKIIIKHRWETQRGNQVARFPNEEEGGVPFGVTYSVPRKALELLRDEMRNRVVVA